MKTNTDSIATLHKSGYVIKCEILSSLENDFSWLVCDVYQNNIKIAAFSSDRCYSTLAETLTYIEKTPTIADWKRRTTVQNIIYQTTVLTYQEQHKYALQQIAKEIEQKTGKQIKDNDRQTVSL